MIKELPNEQVNRTRPWQGYRLDVSNVVAYIKKAYKTKIANVIASRTINDFHPLIQDNYIFIYDYCMASLTAVLSYLIKYRREAQDIYDIVEITGERIFNNNAPETVPIFIKTVADIAAKKIGLNIKSYWGDFKNKGVSWNNIKKLIQNKQPIILSLADDGRDYYKDHSVVVIGYSEYKIDDNDRIRMLKIYDNWRETISYIDFEKLRNSCCINYF